MTENSNAVSPSSSTTNKFKPNEPIIYKQDFDHNSDIQHKLESFQASLDFIDIKIFTQIAFIVMIVQSLFILCIYLENETMGFFVVGVIVCGGLTYVIYLYGSITRTRTYFEIVKTTILQIFNLQNMYVVESIIEPESDIWDPKDMKFVVRDIYGDKETILFGDIIDITHQLTTFIEKTYYIEKELFDKYRPGIVWLVQRGASVCIFSKPNPILDSQPVIDHVLGVFDVSQYIPDKSDTLIQIQPEYGGRSTFKRFSYFEKGMYTIESSGYMSAYTDINSTDNIIKVEFDKRGLQYKVIPNSWQWTIFNW